MHRQQLPLQVLIFMELQFWMHVSRLKLGWNQLLLRIISTHLLRFTSVNSSFLQLYFSSDSNSYFHLSSTQKIIMFCNILSSQVHVMFNV